MNTLFNNTERKKHRLVFKTKKKKYSSRQLCKITHLIPFMEQKNLSSGPAERKAVFFASVKE